MSSVKWIEAMWVYLNVLSRVKCCVWTFMYVLESVVSECYMYTFKYFFVQYGVLIEIEKYK